MQPIKKKNKVSNLTENIKMLMTAAGLVIVLMGGLIHLHIKVNTNTVRVEKVEIEVKELEKENQQILTLLNNIRIENLNNFNDIKIQLKDKADRANSAIQK
jgi:uncharacterized protein YkvS